MQNHQIRKYKKLSLSREYFYFAAIVFAIIISALVWLLWFSYENLEADKDRTYILEAARIQDVVEDMYIYTTNFIKFVGTRIAASDENDAKSIAAILQTKIDVSKIKSDIFPWTVLEFVDNNNYAIASTAGIVTPPLKVDDIKRPWIKTARTQPWILHLSDPDIGIVSGEYIIPGGYGITDKNGKFLGMISAGFHIKKLKAKIKRSLHYETSKFMLLTNDFKLIASSDDNNGSSIEKFITELKKHSIFQEDTGKFLDGVVHNGVIYGYYKIMRPYNYIILIGESKQYLHEEFRNLVMPQIVKTLVLGMAFLVLLYFFRMKIVNPMILLSERARSLSQGKLNIKMPTANSTEAAYLVEALEMVKNSLQKEKSIVKQLAEANEKVRVINANLEKKVAVRTKDLQKALVAKTEFLNNISHEIRTPIQGVTGISQGLVDNWQTLNEERRLEIAKHVANNGRRLLSLVGNLLDLSKFTAGKMLLTFQKMDFNLLVKDMIDECNTLYINNKNIKLNFHYKDNIFCEVDRERIMQVLRNLFVNAIKFTKDNSIIKIHVSSEKITGGKEKEVLHFSIRNQGIGIPEDEIEEIFDPFTQGTNIKTKAGGTGLGLAICREIILGHDGKIWAENNKDKAGGATLHFVIPLVHSKRSKDFVTLQDMNIKPEKKHENTKPITILIIDDEDACLLSMELLLYKTGYKLVKANGGVSGLEYLQINGYKTDVVMLDLMMPDMHGLDVLSEINKNPKLNNIKVILQTGIADEKVIEQAYKMGIKGYIKKPYHKNNVLAEINKVISS